MFDTSKLRGRIIEKFGSQKSFCEAVGCSVAYLSNYLNGKAHLTQGTIAKWSQALDIPSGELDMYFFTLKVHEMEQ